MKFGKLSDISEIVFSLPKTQLGPPKLLHELPQSQSPGHFYIGATGWSMKEWVGEVYPKHAKSKDFLQYYSQQFNTIELNTTHYRIPTESTIQKWYEQSTEDFKFCPKVPQTISHSRNLGLGTDKIPMFCNAIAGLREKLGCCFMQLPPYFGIDRLGALETFSKPFQRTFHWLLN